MITDTQLTELKRLEQAATKGPWTSDGIHEGVAWIEEIWVNPDYGIEGIAPNDAAFIVAARNLLPDLLAEVERLRAEVDALNYLLRLAVQGVTP